MKTENSAARAAGRGSASPPCGARRGTAPAPSRRNPGPALGVRGKNKCLNRFLGPWMSFPFRNSLSIELSAASVLKPSFPRVRDASTRLAFPFFFLKKAIPSWRYIVHIQGL